MCCKYSSNLVASIIGVASNRGPGQVLGLFLTVDSSFIDFYNLLYFIRRRNNVHFGISGLFEKTDRSANRRLALGIFVLGRSPDWNPWRRRVLPPRWRFQPDPLDRYCRRRRPWHVGDEPRGRCRRNKPPRLCPREKVRGIQSPIVCRAVSQNLCEVWRGEAEKVMQPQLQMRVRRYWSDLARGPDSCQTTHKCEQRGDWRRFVAGLNAVHDESVFVWVVNSLKCKLCDDGWLGVSPKFALPVVILVFRIRSMFKHFKVHCELFNENWKRSCTLANKIRTAKLGRYFCSRREAISMEKCSLMFFSFFLFYYSLLLSCLDLNEEAVIMGKWCFKSEVKCGSHFKKMKIVVLDSNSGLCKACGCEKSARFVVAFCEENFAFFFQLSSIWTDII